MNNAIKPADFSFENVLGLSGKESVVKKPKRTEVLDSFSMDKEMYADIYKESEAIQDSVAEGNELLRTYAD